MSYLPAFFQGWLIGFAIAAPVGPISVLCIRRTLADGRLVGFLSGLGAASADMCYGAIAALGITALRDLLTLTNPATILSFTLIFAGLNLGEASRSFIAAGFLVAGVFLGSASWWLTLSSLVGTLRQGLLPAWMVWVNRGSGAVIAGFGMAALLII